MTEMLQYPFMQRALIAGLLISVCAALVGVPLVLRKNSMIGDGLSHTAFSAFALATVLGFAPIGFALPVVVLASFFVLRLSKNRKIHGDAAIGVLSASSLAIGTFAISVSKGVNIDLNSYLFGSILSVSWLDVLSSAVLTLFALGLYLFAYHRIFAITFDEDFAKSVGVKTEIYDVLFAAICSVVIVLGMRLLGSLLISSLVIFPTLSAMRLCRTFKGVIVASIVVSIIAFVVGLMMSYAFSTPTGATIVLANLAVFILTTIYGKIAKQN